MKKEFLLLIMLLIIRSSSIQPQKKPLDLAIIGEPLKDFTLPQYHGGEFQLSKNIGKNILLVFPRGYYDKDVWCDICAYEYLDLVDEFYNQNLAKKYNLNIIIILPYDELTIDKWLKDIPEVYASLEAGKFLSDTLNNEKSRTWVNFARKHYPKTFKVLKGETPNPFTILVDEKQELSERLDIFKNEWWGTKVDQNIPTFILLDVSGNTVFKYISQHTIDRPTMKYLMTIMDALLNKNN
jgi:peroxiredoxin